MLQQLAAASIRQMYRRRFPFYRALSEPGVTLICELKKASPSKGILDPEFQYLHILEDYLEAGAGAISVLTEEDHFMGSGRVLKDVVRRAPVYSSDIGTPLLKTVLRKDFITDPYQIKESAEWGAGAILLIAALLPPPRLKEFLDLAHEAGMCALVEVHNEDETRAAVDAGARIIGVNHRDLRTFAIDMELSAKLRPLVPPDCLFVAESGIQTPDDIRNLRKIGVDAVLLGECVMTAPDRRAFIGECFKAGHESMNPQALRFED